MPGPLATRRILTTRPAVAPPAAGGSDPTVLGSNLKVWVEFDSANVHTNDDGTGTVSDGGAVGYVAGLGTSPTTPNFVQATGGNKPTWVSANSSIKLGSTLRLASASPVALAGAFTVYAVITRGNLATLFTVCDGASAYSAIMIYSDNNCYNTQSGGSTYVQKNSIPTGLTIARWRRLADDSWKMASTGMAEANMSDSGGTNVLSGTFNVQTIGGRPFTNEWSHDTSEIRCIIVADKDAVAGGEDATIRAYLLAKYSGLTDIS